MSELRNRTVRALGWNFAATFGNQAVQFLITVVMARLLSPAEYGLVAMLAFFISFSAVLVESGFGSALIQKQDATRTDESSVFYFNLGAALLLYGALWFAARPIAVFYHEPLLVPLARGIALTLIFNAFGMVQTSLLAKNLDFKTQGKALILSTAVSGVAGILAALGGYGVWSLAVQTVTLAFTRSALLWVFSPWRPLPAFSPGALKAMLPFGSRLLFSGLMGTMYANFFPLTIGKLFSKGDLGLYTRAQSFQGFVGGSFYSTIGAVIFPTFSAIQHDRALLYRACRKALTTSSLAAFPLMFGLLATADSWVQVLFGAKWALCVPYLRLFCLSGALYHIHALNLTILKAAGRSNYVFRLDCIKIALVLLTLLATYRFGMLTMVCGQVAASFLALWINTRYTGEVSGYGFRKQMRDVAPAFLTSALMALVVYSFNSLLLPLAVYLRLPATVLAGVMLYAALSHIFKLRGADEVRGIINDVFTRRVPAEV